MKKFNTIKLSLLTVLAALGVNGSVTAQVPGPDSLLVPPSNGGAICYAKYGLSGDRSVVISDGPSGIDVKYREAASGFESSTIFGSGAANIIEAAIGERFGQAAIHIGQFRSSSPVIHYTNDGGLNWTPMLLTAPPQYPTYTNIQHVLGIWGNQSMFAIHNKKEIHVYYWAKDTTSIDAVFVVAKIAFDGSVTHEVLGHTTAFASGSGCNSGSGLTCKILAEKTVSNSLVLAAPIDYSGMPGVPGEMLAVYYPRKANQPIVKFHIGDIFGMQNILGEPYYIASDDLNYFISVPINGGVRILTLRPNGNAGLQGMFNMPGIGQVLDLDQLIGVDISHAQYFTPGTSIPMAMAAARSKNGFVRMVIPQLQNITQLTGAAYSSVLVDTVAGTISNLQEHFDSPPVTGNAPGRYTHDNSMNGVRSNNGEVISTFIYYDSSLTTSYCYTDRS